ncbi:Carbon starvation protein A [Phycisphaerae bacterium RAS1]|nr:Carbon starvation protein A [Phycisphaerae bacterium RAS1]
MNSLWLVVGSLAAFAIAYRLYGAFLATRVAMLDDSRPTPAQRLNDGVDYHPTNKYVLFGVHFAAIAGPGPLVGPVLASQWGFFPGFIWIVIGACLAGAVHDFVILWASVRQDGLSLPRIARSTIGDLSGVITSIATLFIIICTLASVAIVVVNALAESSWGMFTIVVTIPAALLTGLWMYKIRPGKVAEASVIGVTIVLLGVFFGRPFAESAWSDSLLFSPTTLKLLLPAYAAVAAILPVWVLMCPRDYLSSYMKIGVIAVLAVGIFAAHPTLKMPATTPFLSGGGPVISGPVWPFICIVIMCGAISGFHALIASGTTPKMISKESHIRPIGYGAMVVEGFVAVTALVAACALEPGDYFAINVDQRTPAEQAHYAAMLETVRTEHDWNLHAVELNELESGTGEARRADGTGGLRGRSGGAVTLAVGMAKVFSSVPGLAHLMSYWYHFVIMFEALFILTLLETGTRVARFVVQEAVGQFSGREGANASLIPHHAPGAPLAAPGAASAASHRPNWAMNVGMSLLTCFAWGYLLYTGNINTLWRMLGIANQLLASIALAVGTTYLLLHAPKRVYALCTAIPFFFVLATTLTAGVQSVQGWWGRIATAPPGEAFSLRLMSVLATIMLALVVVIAADAMRRWVQILSPVASRTAARPA